MSSVKLKRLNDGIADYVIIIGGSVSQMIHIHNHQTLVDMYIAGLHHDGNNAPVTWIIEGTNYTFDYETACWVFGTIEDWFWEYADTAESRAVV